MTDNHSKTIIIISVIVIVSLTIISFVSKTWILTSVVIGFLFGFVMQKGSFCSASMASSVVLFNDWRGLKAMGAAILVSMAGFAVIAEVGWIILNPKSMQLLPMALGGFVFGVGTVLGGGCIAGSLYKAGEGRFNSMLALLGIGLGTNMMKKGILVEVIPSLNSITSDIKIPKSLDQLSGVDFIFWVLSLCLLTVAIWLILRKKDSIASRIQPSLYKRIFHRKWSIVTAGIVIGIIGWLAYLSSSACARNYPLGVTSGVMAVAALLAGVNIKIKWWLLIEVIAIVAGSAVSAKLSGDLKLRSADPTTLIISFIGGVIMGIGAVTAQGCFIGNMISGWALLSIGSIIAGVFMVLGNWIAAYFYLRGY